MNFDTIIETERLFLRMVTDDMYEDILLHHSDSDIMKYLDIKADDITKEKERAKKGYSMFNKSLLIFQLIDKKSNEIIGWCGFHTWYKAHNRAEMGYAITNEHLKAKGLMTEAMKPILNYGFKQMNLNRIEALIGPSNIPSLKLLQKFGFTKEGQLRKHYFTNGKFEDSIVFSLLKED